MGMENQSTQPLAIETAPPASAIRTADTALDRQTWQDRHREVLRAATADNTRRTYRAAVRHFQNWGGPLPSDPEAIVRYLLAFADVNNPRTLALRLTALAQWHRAQGFSDPTASPDVHKTLLGIQRLHGKPKRKAKALAIDELECIVAALRAQQGLIATRDLALVQLAFFGAFRRSELVAITCADLDWQPDGLVILLPRSKTDQTGEGLRKAIPYGEPTGCCPARALRAWLVTANINDGPIFRAINRWGGMRDDGLHPSTINAILKTRAEEAGLIHANALSSHSFRRGLATSAHRAGADFLDIKRQGGWKNDGTVQGYIEEAEQFTANAAGHLLKRRQASPNLE